MNVENVDYKFVIFSRYIGQFQQATEDTATIRKSSEDIQYDLLSMASLSIDEISCYMVKFEYCLGFSGGETPMWLMQQATEDREKIEQ